MRIGFHSIKVHNVLTEIRYDSTEINKIRYNRTAFMLSRVRGERVMADMVQDNLCCSRSVVDWAKVTRSLLGAVSFPVIGLLVPYGMSKQGIHDIFPYFFHRNRHCEPASLQGERQRYVIDAENGMLEFPGGGIKVQNWTSHFNPLYLFQEFMRHKIALAEIREIHPPLNMRQTVYGNGRSRASVPSRIELNGDFSAVSLSFRSKEKRDELYLALVRVHHIPARRYDGFNNPLFFFPISICGRSPLYRIANLEVFHITPPFPSIYRRLPERQSSNH